MDLPNITETEKQKLSHKDFYEAKEHSKKVNEEEQKLHSDQIDRAFESLLSSDIELKKTKESKEMAKISEDPFSKWQALYYIDNIKERNRPLDAKAKKQDAPFFLFDLDAAIQGNDAGQDLYGVQYFTGKKEMDDESKPLTSIIQESKNLSREKMSTKGQELKQLLEQYHEKSYTAIDLLEFFRGISPSAIELEMLSLTDFEFDTNKNINYVSGCLITHRSIHSYASSKK